MWPGPCSASTINFQNNTYWATVFYPCSLVPLFGANMLAGWAKWQAAGQDQQSTLIQGSPSYETTIELVQMFEGI